MVTIRVHPHVAPRSVHPGWLLRSLTDIGNADQRKAILAADRFAARIASGLLPYEVAGPDKPAKIERQMALLLDHLDVAFLTLLGQLWYAPVLATRIMGPDGRAFGGLSDRQTLRRLLTYRDHAQPTVIGALPSVPDYHMEGALCLSAWLDKRPDTDVADRLRLTLPPPLSADEAAQGERAALVGRVLSDPDLMGE